MNESTGRLFIHAFIVLAVIFTGVKGVSAQSVSGIPHALIEENVKSPVVYSENSLILSAAKGTDLYISPNGKIKIDNLPKVHFQPKSDFVLIAKIGGQFQNVYDGGALIVYVDSANWAKMLFEQFASGVNGVGTLVAKLVGDDSHHFEYPGHEIYFKIERKETVFTFYWPADGESWGFLRSFGMSPPHSQSLKVGFAAQSPSSEKVEVLFSDIRFNE
ncbi:MAG: DUF1349 domain-containing protein [Melioribacteraceae bacterium]|nr:DUF1349 domain-containing protein [Melioribacteraceae bacterium]MCF8263185.1 DUF1349 domain-containing protein [Melioribacteraceae bacterium]MCF8430327.1 DUF1349 domain-containing protein [Melioribacteraceae bacterium]